MKKYWSIGLLLAGIVTIFQGSFLGGLFISLTGIIIFPSISEKLKAELPHWQKKSVRYTSYFMLLIIGFAIGGANLETNASTNSNGTNTKQKRNKLYQEYLNKSEQAILELSEERKSTRDDIITKLENNIVFKELVNNNITSTEYLPVLHAIAYGLSTMKGEKFSLDENMHKRLLNSANGEEKAAFFAHVTALSSPYNAGFTRELVQVFERYKNKYKMYGGTGFSYNTNGGGKEEIKYNFDLTPIFTVLAPKDKEVLNSIFKAKSKGYSTWHKGNDYTYSYIASREEYNNHLKRVYPNSPYVINYDYNVTASQLFGEYESNEVAADSKYKGKMIYIEGTIQSVGKDILGNEYVALEVSNNIIATVQCFVKDANSLIRLKKGQKVSLLGKGDGYLLNVFLRKCEVIKE